MKFYCETYHEERDTVLTQRKITGFKTPKNNFDLSKFYGGLNMYNGLRDDPHQWRRFNKIICIQDGEIIYEKSHIG